MKEHWAANDAIAGSETSVSGFDGCPADILYLVFKLLSPAELRGLCLVNKISRSLAQPFLYSKIQWTWRDPHFAPPIIQLLRTLLCRPQLAAYITNLHLDGKVFRQHPFRFSIPKITISDIGLEKFVAFIRGTGVPYSDFWIQEVSQGTTDALVALLLAQGLSNLRCLYLGPVFAQRSTLIGMVLRSAICEPKNYRLPDFQHLRDVSFLSCIYWDEARDKKIKNTVDILPVLYLPSLRRMSASIENSATFTWPVTHLPMPSNVTSLDLTQIREAYLGEVLSVTPKLKILRWKFYYDFGIHDAFNQPIVNLDQIVTAISHVRNTLTDLTILADCGIGGNDQFLPGIKMEGSLRAMVDWEMLKRLQVPWAFLVGFAQDKVKRLQDFIPRNIELLTITDDLRLQNDDEMVPEWPRWEWEDHVIVELIRAWLHNWKAYTPHLHCLTLILSLIMEDFGEWPPSIRQHFMELGAQAGVQVEIIEQDYYEL
ncbi:uncharacterized protein N7496_003663 [Penicillium cataractarum]|uniref:F-box domain-containing protein n=1 Tax=Penicillium cataractarum TaxID=2100454 RepID=A0A9W9VJ20_9EURO|nr:uncharacterized protein N7496_003663 [Penicillium cataractarum]KAJ5381235.1 hypothetical protein N7496_003663 [Penicillium cataractarum]